MKLVELSLSYHPRSGMNNSRLRMGLRRAATRRAMAHPPRRLDCIMKISSAEPLGTAARQANVGGLCVAFKHSRFPATRLPCCGERGLSQARAGALELIGPLQRHLPPAPLNPPASLQTPGVR